MTSPRLAVRALILHEDALLLVNAYPGGKSDLWCAPGGGVNRGTSLPENLQREVHEETGLTIAVGAPALINEFHDPLRGFHQVEVFFHATICAGVIDPAWKDPAGVVTDRRFFTQAALQGIRFKPDSLPHLVWPGTCRAGLHYDPLERIVP
ncbi:MAG: NUDIX hydrolase [Rhodobacteraceae bacterium]|jgi:8-oxo-dGTP diphosphatase|nr:NUDIX hydrolase [Paracoccaceae bacterium]